jgi:CBS domain-containing protein
VLSERDLATVDEAVSLEQATRPVTGADLRHLTVSRAGRVVGVISIRDVLAVLLEAAASLV